MDARLRRVNKEIAGRFRVSKPPKQPPPLTCYPLNAPDCKKDKASNIDIQLVDENPFHLIGSFPGPEDTPYQGGHFQVVSRLNAIITHSNA